MPVLKIIHIVVEFILFCISLMACSFGFFVAVIILTNLLMGVLPTAMLMLLTIALIAGGILAFLASCYLERTYRIVLA